MEQLYGNFEIEGLQLRGLHADRIIGAHVRGSSLAIQFAMGAQRVQLDLSIQTGLHLLSVLQAVHSDSGGTLPPPPTRAY